MRSILFAGVVPGIVAGLAMLTLPAVSSAQVAVSIAIAPPELPVYEQPPCPVDGYLWTPGYWAYGPSGYYWVPGVWVNPPRVGVLWTPAYWGFAGGYYGFHPGYWGPHVGFYGGVNYGYGYGGVGYAGGAWRGERFAYNTSVTRVNETVIHNTYNERVVVNNESRASFNGPGGINARAGEREQMAEREQHFQPTQNQLSHESAARADRGQLASVNRGRPSNAAMARPMSGGPTNRSVNTPMGHTPPPSPNRNVNNFNHPPQGDTGQPHPTESTRTGVTPSNRVNTPPPNQKSNGQNNVQGHGQSNGQHQPPPSRERHEGKEK